MTVDQRRLVFQTFFHSFDEVPQDFGMMAQSSQCDREQLARLLDGQLDDAAQTLVAAHLETCDGCREQLQTFAADKQWWQETREALSEQDVLDEESAAAFRDQRDAVAPVPLDFLAQSDNPVMLGRIGEFEILELIGCGGMGIVLKGYDHELNRYVAVSEFGLQNARQFRQFAMGTPFPLSR